MYGVHGGLRPTRCMRKMILEVCPKDPLMGMPVEAPDLNRAVKQFLDRVESIKIIEFLKVDFSCGEETVVAEITMKAGYTAIEHLRKAEARLIATLLAGY